MGGLLAIEVSEAVWLAAIGVLTIVVKEYFDSKRAKRAETKVDEVAVELKQQTGATISKLDGIANTGEKTHDLVNSNMAVQLRLNKAMARRIADGALQRGEPSAEADKIAAELAENLYVEHQMKQGIVDKKETAAAALMHGSENPIPVITRTEAAEEKKKGD